MTLTSNVASATPPARSEARILLTGLRLLVYLFAVVGVSAVAVQIAIWQGHLSATPITLVSPWAMDAKSAEIALVIWNDIKFVLQNGAYLLGAVAVLIAAIQIKTVARLVSDFIKARGPIYALGTTITQVETSVGTLTNQVDRLSKMEPTIQLISEKLEDTLKQISNWQRSTVSERTDAQAGASAAAAGPAAVDTPPVPDAPKETDANWLKLRAFWNANGDRLDAAIERIPQKRGRTKIRSMPRTDYTAIINALADGEHITEAARDASLKLHSTFMSYKPRNRNIPDHAVGSLEVLDAMLEKELSPTTADETSPPLLATA